MFKNSYQSGLLSIFYSCGSHPLALWDMEVNNGHIKRLTDKEVNSIVLEIVSTNVATTYITCPPDNKNLGIKLPFLVMIVKNLKRYFSFEITVLDDKNMRRRFRISNFQSTTKIKPFCTTMPIGLSGGWNQIQFNLSDFTRRAYGTQFIETLRVQVHANVRLRRIYFAERLYTEEELPQDYKLYLPLDRKGKKVKDKKQTETAANIEEPPPAEAKVSAEAEAPPEIHPSAPALDRKSTMLSRKSTTAESRKSMASESRKSTVGRKSTAAESKKSTVAAPTPEGEEEDAVQGEATGGEVPEEKAPEGEVLEGELTEGIAPTAEGEAEAPPEGELPVEESEAPPTEAAMEVPPEAEAPPEVPVETPAEEQAEVPAEEAPAEG